MILLASLALLAACQREDVANSGRGFFGGGNQTAANPGVRSARGDRAPTAMGTTSAQTAPATPAPMTAPAPMATPPAAGTQDRRLRITNNSGQPVTLIKGSPTNERNWGADRIPQGLLQPGASVVVDFNDGNGQCDYDLQATMQDGTTRVQRGVNICRIANWTITAQDSTVR